TSSTFNLLEVSPLGFFIILTDLETRLNFLCLTYPIPFVFPPEISLTMLFFSKFFPICDISSHDTIEVILVRFILEVIENDVPYTLPLL
ncbi:MAG: hypothetical protein OCU17_08360, partial [Methanophagales archaeon]|nr:hypothetical protein [Methanophagales archaeon]